MEIIGHADEWAAERIPVGGVEIEIVLAMGIVAARRADAEGVVVPLGGRLLPFATPTWRAGRNGPRLDRPAVRSASRNPGSTEEAQARMVEIVAIEVVDVHAEGRARSHERIDYLVFEEHRDAVA